MNAPVSKLTKDDLIYLQLLVQHEQAAGTVKRHLVRGAPYGLIDRLLATEEAKQ